MTGPQSDDQSQCAQAEALPWKRVWEARPLTPSHGSILSQLLKADGYDTPFGTVDEAGWIEFVNRRAADLGIRPGMSVFEVGCGAGAFLHELRVKGCAVGGIDWSQSLIDIARLVMPDGDFDVKKAAQLAVDPPAHFVVSCSVFEYFSSIDYARHVIERMAAKAERAVAIFDIPDRSAEQAALEYRKALVGGAASYTERYEGLDHLYYDREWLTDVMHDCGLEDVHVTDQDLARYASSAFRFNAWGFMRPQA